MEHKTIRVSLLLMVLASILLAGIQPLPRVVAESEARKAKFTKTKNPNLIGYFFEEGYASDAYPYVYPEETSKIYMGEGMGKAGEVALVYDLDAREYSGAGVVLENTAFDLKDQYGTGAIEFWIRGAEGGEKCFISLADDEMDDGKKAEISVDIDKYGGIQPYWTHVSIPLADFGTRGSYWDEKNDREVKMAFDWHTVKEFLVVIEKGANKNFKIFLDNIYIVKDRYEVPDDLYAPYWDEIEEVVPSRPDAPESAVVILDTLYDNDFDLPMYGEVYGGKTAYRLQPTEDTDLNPWVMGLYLDNSDYSGVTLNWGKKYDVRDIRANGGGLAFWAYFDSGVTQIFVGVTDDNSDGKAVGTSVLLSDFGDVEPGWHYMMIPLKEFGEDGGWWDEEIMAEKPGTMDYTKINALTFTSDKYGNRVVPGKPVKMFIDQVAIIESVPGYVDPEAVWDLFVSNEPDRMLFDFEDGENGWDMISGELSSIKASVKDQTDRALRDQYGRYFMQIDWSRNDWGYVGYPLARLNAGPAMRDWTKHSMITFDVYTPRDVHNLEFKIKDAGLEEWTATVKVKKGWNHVELPFRKLRKYPYYQVPGALVDGVLDLSNVSEISFEPADLGITSMTLIDNIKLTQEPKK